MSTQDPKNQFRPVLVVSLVLGLAILLGYYFIYIPYSEASEESFQTSLILMDTVVDVRVDGRKPEELVNKTLTAMEELEQIFSRFVATSEVAKINQEAGQWVKVSPTTLDLIELGIKMGDLTQGSFDITIGIVLDLWGFGSSSNRVPSREELDLALTKVGYEQVEVDRENNQVRIPEGVILDLGGIAKGYIVDQGNALLKEGKATRSIINAGGDIAVLGNRPDGQPWRVGVQDPDKPSEIRWILPLEDTSVVTSGDYQRFFLQDGQRWHHIIDPKTGYPATALRSVTVVGPDTATCDALSTAIFILGMEEGQMLVEKLADVEAILVSSEEVWISPGLSQHVTTQ